MVRELNINRSTSNLRWIGIKTSDHCGGRYLICHFQKCLVFTLQHKNICYTTKWYTQLYNISFTWFIWYISDVYYPWRFAYNIFRITWSWFMPLSFVDVGFVIILHMLAIASVLAVMMMFAVVITKFGNVHGLEETKKKKEN